MMQAYRNAVESVELVRRIGRVTQFFGLVVESNGPEAFLGERCEVHSRGHAQSVPAEVIGIKDGKVLLMPYGELRGIRLGSEVIATGQPVQVPVGAGLLGRVIDAFGRPMDGQPLMDVDREYPLYAEPLNPLDRPPIREILETGVKAIDGLLTVGKGQRVGIFSGSGVGKSTLLGMIARYMRADVNVIALIGERGREVRDFIEQSLGPEGLKRSVVVVATSDQSSLVRAHAAFTATSVAEYFRDQGLNVVLTMDSVTRFAMAQREIGLAVGEPPTARGYTPSVFAALPKLLERGGTYSNSGSITTFCTVLVESDDINDPIGDSVRSILDGHIVLSRDLASRGHYPAIDLMQSNSRLMSELVTKPERELSQRVLKTMSVYLGSKDMVDLGAYRAGANPELDQALKLMPAVEEFLCQDTDAHISRAEAMSQLSRISQGRSQ